LSQLDRDDRIQQLWETAANVLDFLKESQPTLDAIPSQIIEALMKQIYDCAHFIREYAGQGFLSKHLFLV
jgi:hypothetical protein